MIRVIHIIGRLNYGGAEKLLLDLCRKIDKEKFEVSVVVLQDNNPLAEAFENAGIKLEYFHKKGKLDFGVINRVARYLKEENPDVVHTHLFGADYWGSLAARKAGVEKIISTKHDILNEGFARRFLGRRARRKFDKVVAISNATKEFLIEEEKIPVEKVQVIYNGIDVHKFYIENPSLFETDALTIGSIGRLSKEKGHKHLIRACRFLRKRTWRLTLVGEGPLRKELEAQARFLGVEDRVKFTGLVEDVREALQEFDVFVLPSVSEGLSLSVLEAALAGKFVVATNVGGVPEIITHKETGLLFKPKRIEELLKHLEWVIEHKGEARRMALALQKNVLENFDINKVVKEYEDLYLSLIKK